MTCPERKQEKEYRGLWGLLSFSQLLREPPLLSISGSATGPFKEEHDSGSETLPEPGIADSDLLQYFRPTEPYIKMIFLSSKEAFLGVTDVSI